MIKTSKFRLFSVFVALAAVFQIQSPSQSPVSSPAKPEVSDDAVNARANALLKSMTVEEKVGQTMQYFQLFPETHGLEEMARKGQIGSLLFMTDAAAINRAQHAAVEGSRLHIPLIFGFDVIHGWRTIFPVPLAMASSWDPKMVEEVQTIAALEARASGINWTFAPMVDIARDARWGRIVEGAGEDPFLGSAMAKAQVLGFQGASLGTPDHLVATVKHFAAYGAAEGGRDYDSTYVPDVLLWNTYFPPYKAAVDAGAGSVMSSYQELNDVPATANRWLLHDVLRDDWGFKGFVVSDASAVYNLTTQGLTRDAQDAAYRALTAGVNMEMGFPAMHLPANSVMGNKEETDSLGEHTYDVALVGLVKAGRISETQLDDAVRPILATKIKMGLFEHPYVDEARTTAVLTDVSHRTLARKAAQESMVLLKDEGQLLPLSKSTKSIAVIGTLADSGREIMGPWVFQGKPEEAVSVLQGIRNKVPAAAVSFVRGAEIKRPFPNPVSLVPVVVPDQSEAQLDEQIKSAVEAARVADVSVLVLGERDDMNGESASRATLDFPGAQERLLEAVSAVGKPVVLVLLNGRPLAIDWAAEHVPAILEAWYPGTEGGNAIADVLFGDVNPSGKLTVTWPRTAGAAPIYYAHNITKAPDTAPGFHSRYWDVSSAPLFRFGYGLAYTQFKVSKVKVNETHIAANGQVEVSAEVENTGSRAGEDVVQLYIHQQAGSATRPVRQLQGFQKVMLAPGEKKSVHFTLGPAELQFWSPVSKSWVVEPEKFDVWVGDDVSATEHGDFSVDK